VHCLPVPVNAASTSSPPCECCPTLSRDRDLHRQQGEYKEAAAAQHQLKEAKRGEEKARLKELKDRQVLWTSGHTAIRPKPCDAASSPTRSRAAG